MKNTSILILLIFFIILTTCVNDKKYNSGVATDLADIKKRGRLIALTNYNTTDYFIFRGQPLGFQFEILQKFAEYSGLQLEIISCNDMDEITSMLIEGKCDLVAMGIPVTSEQKRFLSFTLPIMQSRQVLVQRKPDNWKILSASELNSSLIKSPLELGDKTIVVQRNTAFAQRLRNIVEETGNRIDIVEVPENEEHIIQFVASGEIDYTICDEGTAMVNKNYFPQLDVSTVVSFPQNISWAVRKKSPQLEELLNNWLVEFKKSSQISILFNKYYQNQWSAQMVNNDYFVLNTGKISPYDEEIKKYSSEINWDWRLLASLIYQESNFNPAVRSYAGAYGLMQITSATAQRFGVDSTISVNPLNNMAIGVKLIKWLDTKMGVYVIDPDERIKFVLAAYNIGIGHVLDAMQLAKKYNYDMTKWSNVSRFLLNKSKPVFYNDPLVKFGYCRGVETVNYVSEILSLFQHYKNITKNF